MTARLSRDFRSSHIAAGRRDGKLDRVTHTIRIARLAKEPAFFPVFEAEHGEQRADEGNQIAGSVDRRPRTWQSAIAGDGAVEVAFLRMLLGENAGPGEEHGNDHEARGAHHACARHRLLDRRLQLLLVARAGCDGEVEVVGQLFRRHREPSAIAAARQGQLPIAGIDPLGDGFPFGAPAGDGLLALGARNVLLESI